VDRFVRLRLLDRAENNKTTFRSLPYRMNRKIKAASALKKIRLLLTPDGGRSKSKKGLATKNNNRPPKNKKAAIPQDDSHAARPTVPATAVPATV